MRKLGLVGGIGPESTVPYYMGIVYGVQKELGVRCFPNLTIESVDVYHTFELFDQGKTEQYIDYFARAIDNLAAAGAELAALTGNTPHIFFAELKARARIPLVSMLETTKKEILRQGYQKVALLGTSYTMQSDYYQKALAGAALVVPPLAEEIDFIGGKIRDELELGIRNQETLMELQKIIIRMGEDEGVEAVILGCTELPMLLNSETCPLPCIDTMQVHIKELIRLIVS